LELAWEDFEEQAIQTEEGNIFNICQPPEKIEKYLTKQVQALFPSKVEGRSRVIFKKSRWDMTKTGRRRW
jgi:hypothetical protein